MRDIFDKVGGSGRGLTRLLSRRKKKRKKKPRGERENDVLVGSLTRGKLLAYCEKKWRGKVCLLQRSLARNEF